MDLLSQLRRRTRARHASLDAGLDFRSRAITRQRYGAFLRGILAVVAPLEAVLAPADRSRTDALRADLATLGLSRDVESIPVRLPRSVAEAYGCGYVLEGSALGGLVLAPLVEDSLGTEAPTAYLRLRGADTAKAWKAWLARLDAFGAAATAEDADAACDIACATFDAYCASLRLTGVLEEERACTP